MLLIFGGTTEGKQVIQLMQALKQPYHYSTKTKVDYKADKLGVYRHGALDEAALLVYIQKYKIKKIINAAHPFATVLHQTIAKVCSALAVPVYRLERSYLERQVHPLIHYIATYEETLELLLNQFKGKKLLALTGVQSMALLAVYWKVYPTLFRILDRPSSIAIAEAQKFPRMQLILAYPNKELDKEIKLYKAHKIEVVLTKESGNSGQMSTKIAAALALEIPIIIIKKPKLPKTFESINDLETLKNKFL